jgi:hypothetical protein
MIAVTTPSQCPAVDAPQLDLMPKEKRLGMLRIPTVPQAEPSELTAKESSILFAFRAMDYEAREDIHRFVLSTAMAHPRRTAPSLRLIIGGTK